MTNNLFKWQRSDGAWHLWRGYPTDDGAMIWQETGYIVTGGRGTWYAKSARRSWLHMKLREAKAWAENLAAKS